MHLFISTKSTHTPLDETMPLYLIRHTKHIYGNIKSIFSSVNLGAVLLYVDQMELIAGTKCSIIDTKLFKA